MGQNNPLVDGIMGELTNHFVQSPLQALALGSRPRPGITPPPYLPLPFQQLSLPLPGCSILCCPEYINRYLPHFPKAPNHSLVYCDDLHCLKTGENQSAHQGRPPLSQGRDDLSGHLWSDEVCQQSKGGQRWAISPLDLIHRMGIWANLLKTVKFSIPLK